MYLPTPDDLVTLGSPFSTGPRRHLVTDPELFRFRLGVWRDAYEQRYAEVLAPLLL